ncbi:MAG: enoyl-CoA hydratase/isomerase family protein [Syntrophaceae bacterium]|nr:enoyl-CoA hydratase/isomerase family protein [Syntrophaceae bacterium]
MSIMMWEKDETVAILTMTNGANRQNLVFSDTLNKTLDEIIADKTVTALIITSDDEKNFSQGIDVEWILDKMQKKETQPVIDFIRGMDVVFKKLVTYPVPVIAAINGHAFGNGSIMSCACDFRFMRSDKGFFCFPEVNLGIAFRPGMNAFIKKAVPAYKLSEMQLTGNRYTAQELEEHHIIVKACADKEDLMTKSLAFAKTFKKNRGIFSELKKRLYKEIIEILEAPDEFASGGAFSLTVSE